MTPKTPESHPVSPPSETVKQKYLRHARVVSLFLWWLGIFVALILVGVVTEHPSLLSVTSTQPKDVTIKDEIKKNVVRVEVNGPFSLPKFEQVLLLSERAENTENNKLTIHLERLKRDENGREVSRVKISDTWTLDVVDHDKLATADLIDRSELIKITGSTKTDKSTSFVVRVQTNLNQLVSLSLLYDTKPFNAIYGLIMSLILLLVYYLLLIFHVVHRTLAAMLVCSMAVGVLGFVHSRPSLHTMLSWMDMEIFMIQFGMTFVVTILLRSGVYDWVALYAFKHSRGHIWPFLYVMIAIVTVSGMFLENIIVVLLIGPFLLLICQMMAINAIPVVIIMTSFLIIGKTPLPFGSILNRRICKHPFLVENSLTPTLYTLHASPFFIIMFISTFCYLRYIFRSSNQIGLVETEADVLKRIIDLLDDTAHAIAGYTKDERNIREEIENKTDSLEDRLQRLGKMPKPVQDFEQKLEHFQGMLGIRKKWLLIACIFPLAFIFILSLYNLSTGYHMDLGWITVLAAFLLIIIIGENDFEELLYHVDWCTLVFLACHQVLASSLDEMGLTENIGSATRYMIISASGSRLLAALVVIYWMSSISALLLDNVKIAQVMVHVLSVLSLDKHLALPLRPSIWAMVFGLRIGCMGTQVSSMTCIVFSGLVERHGIPFPFLSHLKICFPMILINNVVATIYLMIVYVAMDIE